MLAQIKAGEHVVLFPEATTYADGPQPFHSSHFAVAKELFKLGPGYAIQPIAIHYSAPHAPWIGDDALLPHVLGLMRRPARHLRTDLLRTAAARWTQPRRAVAQECFARIAAAYGNERA